MGRCGGSGEAARAPQKHDCGEPGARVPGGRKWDPAGGAAARPGGAGMRPRWRGMCARGGSLSGAPRGPSSACLRGGRMAFEGGARSDRPWRPSAAQVPRQAISGHISAARACGTAYRGAWEAHRASPTGGSAVRRAAPRGGTAAGVPWPQARRVARPNVREGGRRGQPTDPRLPAFPRGETFRTQYSRLDPKISLVATCLTDLTERGSPRGEIDLFITSQLPDLCKL
jgi:hypothetical protein